MLFVCVLLYYLNLSPDPSHIPDIRWQNNCHNFRFSSLDSGDPGETTEAAFCIGWASIFLLFSSALLLHSMLTPCSCHHKQPYTSFWAEKMSCFHGYIRINNEKWVQAHEGWWNMGKSTRYKQECSRHSNKAVNKNLSYLLYLM